MAMDDQGRCLWNPQAFFGKGLTEKQIPGDSKKVFRKIKTADGKNFRLRSYILVSFNYPYFPAQN